jgi:transposase
MYNYLGDEMFIKRIKKNNGRTHLYLVEGYRVNGKIKHRTVDSIGILEELEKMYPNEDVIEMLTQKYKINYDKITIDFATMSKERTLIKNYGYYILEALYEKVGISAFVRAYMRGLNVEYDLDEMLKLLVFSRILYPESKLRTLKNKDKYFGDFDVQLHNIYRGLDILDEMKDDLQYNIHQTIMKKYGRDCTLVLYDVTNYYFEIHENDVDYINENGEKVYGFRRKGMGKDGKRQPLVAMGLVMDSNGIPMTYKLFKGNESDTKTMIPIMETVNNKYGLQKVVFVADKGLNSENNLNYLAGKKHGYIVSHKVRGQSKKITNEVLREDNYIVESESFKYKSNVRKRTLKCDDKSRESVIVNEKVVFFWSKEYYDRSQYKRLEELEKIKHFIDNQKALVKIEKELKPYIIEVIKDRNGKSIKDASVEYEFDKAKFEETCKLDGYYVIVSNETDLSEKEIIERYRRLSEIENNFRIIKSDFEGRPVYVRNKSRIEGHFLICFISLVIMKLFQNITNHEYSVEMLVEAINSATLKPFGKDILLFNETTCEYQKIEEMLGVNANFSYLKIEDFRKYRKSLFDNINNVDFCRK